MLGTAVRAQKHYMRWEEEASLAYRGGNKRGIPARNDHFWQLIKVCSNDGVVGPGMADVLQQLQAAGGQPGSLDTTPV